jgi:hypothetical protein
LGEDNAVLDVSDSEIEEVWFPVVLCLTSAGKI